MATAADPVITGTTTVVETTGANISLLKGGLITKAIIGAVIGSTVLLAGIITVGVVVSRSIFEPPRAVDDYVQIYKGTTVNINVLENDSDPKDAPLFIANVTQPLHGTNVILDSTMGTIIYTPRQYYGGNDSFQYVVSNDKLESVGTVYIRILNNAPEPLADSFLIGKNTLNNTLDVLANDFDLDGDILSIVNVTAPANGTASFNGTHAFYTPNHEFRGTDKFFYTVSDGNDTASTSVTLTIDNNAPVARPDFFTVRKNRLTMLDVLENDFDVNFDELFITRVRGAKGFGFADENLKLVTYVPAYGSVAADSFEYEITDGALRASSYAIIQIVNTSPNASNTEIEVPKNTKDNVIPLHYGDDDPFETLTVAISNTGVAGASHNLSDTTVVSRVQYGEGVTSVNFEEKIYKLTYTPEYGRVYTDKLSFTVSDGQGSAVGNITIVVVNSAPVTRPDFFTCKRGELCTLNVVANDYDPDNDPVRLLDSQSAIVSSQGVSVSLVDTMNVAYRAPKAFIGNDTFTYEIEDVQVGDIGSKTATGVATVTVVNTPPEAFGDAYTVARGSVTDFEVLLNDIDFDDDKLVITEVSKVSAEKRDNNGLPTTSVESSVSIQSITKPSGEVVTVLRYNASSADGYYTEVFKYTISDGYGGSSSANVNITVINTPPVANPNTASMHWNTTNLSIDVLANDDDANPGDKAKLIVHSITATSNGAGSTDSVITSAFGGMIENKETHIVYTPARGFVGTDVFYYYCSDRLDASMQPASVTVQVTNTAPVAVNDTVTMKWGTTADIRILDNDYDPDSDPIAVLDIIRQPTNGAAELADGATTTITYKPAEKFVGHDLIEYMITDWNKQHNGFVHVEVTNQAPVPQNDEATVHWRQSSGVEINVLSNDADPDNDALHVDSISRSPAPAYGTVEITEDKQRVVFKPTTTNIGTTRFSYMCSDSIAQTEAEVAVLITNKNVPAASDLHYRVHWRTQSAGTAVTDIFGDNAVDADGDPMTIDSYTSPNHGTVTKNTTSGNDIQYLIYKQTNGFLGNDSFTYTITDGQASATGVISFTVYNNKPTTTAYTETRHWRGVTAEGINFNVLSGAQDADSADTLTVTSAQCADSVNCEAEISSNNIIVKPKLGYIGTVIVNYVVSDGLETSSNTITVTVTNAQPTATDKEFTVHWSTWEQGSRFNVLANASDPDVQDTVTLKSVASPTKPGSSAEISGSSFALYKPAKAVVGVDTFTYTVTDGNMDATATVTVTVVNADPVAVDDSVTAHWNATQGVTFDPLTNDNDPDSDKISIVSFQQPNQGSVGYLNGDSQQSKLVYRPPLTPFVGTTSFQYTITDGVATAVANVQITVVNPNAPTARDFTYVKHWTTQTDGSNVYPLDSAVVTDADGDRVTLVSTTAASNGQAAIKVDGSGVTHINYKQNAGFLGNDTFTYLLTDGQTTATGTVRFTIYNDAPTTRSYRIVMHWSQIAEGVYIDVLAGAADINPEDTLSIQSVTQSPNGVSSISNGKVKFIPSAGFSGTANFNYVVTDGLLTSTNTIEVIVTNSVPDPQIKQYTVHWRTQFTGSKFDLLEGVVDPEGDPLSLTEVTTPADSGSVVIMGDKSNITYTQNAGFLGVDSFVVAYTDGSTPSHITVYVTVYNNEPVAQFKTYTVHWSTHNGGTLFNVMEGATDADNEELTLASITQPNNNGGSAVIEAGQVRFTPREKFVGTTTFTYTVSDGLASTSRTVTVNVVDQAPVPSEKSYTVHWSNHNAGKVLPVTQGDSDPDHQDTVSLKGVSSITPSTASLPGLSVTKTSDNVLFKPPPPTSPGVHPRLNQDVTFVYTITDGALDASARVTVRIANSLPVAADDTYTYHWSVGKTGAPSLSLNVLANDVDADAEDTLYLLSATTQTANSVSLNGPKDRIIYKPQLGYLGTDRIQYVVTDGASTASASAHVTIYNNPPTTTPLSETKHWKAAHTDGFSFDLIAASNDEDVAAGLDALSIKSVSSNPNVDVTIEDGKAKLAIKNNYIGTMQLTYVITDGLAESSNTISVTITNQVPVATAKTYSVHWSTWNDGTVFDVMLGCTDGDSDTLTLKGTSTPTQGGSAVIQSGKVLYRPKKPFIGTESFTYTITDGLASVTATVTVTVRNSIPVATSKTLSVHWANTGTTINLLAGATDADSEDTVTLSNVSPLDKTNMGTLTQQTSSSIVFKPASNPPRLGSVKFTFSVTDGAQSSSTREVVITVFNTPPVGNNDHYSNSFKVANAQAGLQLNVLDNDSDADGDTLTIKSVTASSSIASITNAGTHIVYRHLSASVRQHTFQYVVTDGVEDRTVDVVFEVINRAPIAVDDAVQTLWHSDVVIPTMDNDSDPDDDQISFVSFSNSPQTPSPQGQLSQVNPAAKDGVLRYTVPVKSAFTYTNKPTNGPWSKTEHFKYTITDPIGLQSTASIAVTVTNHPPVVHEGSLTVARSNPPKQLVLKVLEGATDADGDTVTLESFSREAGKTGGSATKSGNTILYVAPPYPYLGSEVITFTATDGQISVTQQFTVTVGNVPPVCVDRQFNIDKRTQYTYNTPTSDFCTDENGDTLKRQTPGTGATGKGAITQIDTAFIRYRSNEKRSGTDIIEYSVNDGNLNSNVARITLNIVNKPPKANDDSKTIPKGATTLIDVLANDSDPDSGDSLVLKSISSTSCFTNVNAQAKIVSNKLQVTVPNTLRTPTTCQLTYTVSDDDQDNPLTATAKVTVTMSAHNPVAVADKFSTRQGVAIEIPVSALIANDYDDDAPADVVTFKELVPCNTLSAEYCVYSQPQLVSGNKVRVQGDPHTCKPYKFRYRIVTPSDGLEAEADVTVEFTDCICYAAVDVILAYDTSGSVGTTNWATLKSFTLSLVDKFTLGPQQANIGLLTFSTRAIEYKSNKGKVLIDNKDEVKRVISQDIQYDAGWTATLYGLNMAVRNLQSSSRPNVPKVIVVLTDGEANRPNSVNCPFFGGSRSCANGCSNSHECDASHCNLHCTSSCLFSTNDCYGDPTGRAQQINAWRKSSGSAADWKIVALGIGADTFGAGKIKAMNYDPYRYIAVDWANLDSIVQTILDQACDA